MSKKPEYIYIMYPIPIAEAEKFPFLPFSKPSEQPFKIPDEESFMPLWFGNARFPEDDIED